MIKSMTGYGTATAELPDKTVCVEIKALNSKQLDLYTRLPAYYREKDIDIRNELASYLKRGKIEFTITIDYKEDVQAQKLNVPVIKSYYKQLREILKELGEEQHEPLMTAIMRLPEVINTDKELLSQSEWNEVEKAIEKAINDLNFFRIQEGKALKDDMLQRIELIEQLHEQIDPYEKERMISIKNKLVNGLNEFFPANGYDKNRLEQEMILYLERLDINEEKVRLQNHCNYFREVIEEDDAVGKKLSFVAQEIGREINTLGAKANHSDIQRIVILMKDELEKIKEQLMNVL
jgi:uncharacterized protein (TIGR00255 family)